MPIRIEIGPREMDEDALSVVHRTDGPKDFKKQSRQTFINTAQAQLDTIQKTLFDRAKAFQQKHIIKIDSKDAFYTHFKNNGGFAYAHWNGDPAIEDQIQKDLSVTIRCIPFDMEKETGTCIFTGEPSAQRVIFAKSY